MRVNPEMKKRRCSNCKSLNVVQIFYGFPAAEQVDQSEKGEIILGGCCLYENSPDWKCKDCGNEWVDADIKKGFFDKLNN